MWAALLQGLSKLGPMLSKGLSSGGGGGLAKGAQGLFGSQSSGAALGNIGSLGTNSQGVPAQAGGMQAGASNMFSPAGQKKGLFDGMGDSLMSPEDIGKGESGPPKIPGGGAEPFIPDTEDPAAVAELPNSMEQIKGLMTMIGDAKEFKRPEIDPMKGLLMEYLQKLSRG